MKKTLLTLLVLAPFVGQAGAAVIFGGDFQLFKPGTGYTVTGELSGPGEFDSYAQGVGDGVNVVGAIGTVDFADATTGSTADLPGWVLIHGAKPDSGKNGMGGSTGLNVFAAWGGDVRVETSGSLGNIEASKTYTISAMVDGPGGGPIDGPLALHLLADGVALTPSSVVDVSPGTGFRQISRTYDASSIAGHIGESMTIVIGVEDANDFGNRVIFDDVSLDAVASGLSTFPLTITPHASNPGHYDFVWGSQDGKLYDLVSSTDLSTAPATWPVWLGHENIVGTAPENLLSDVPGGGDLKRFFAVVEKAPPPLLSEDFETVVGPNPPTGWSAVDNSAGTTAWQVGTPSGAATGPPAAASGTQCAGTNIGADYTPAAVASLITKAFTVPAGGATLKYRQYIDTEPAPSGDLGSIRLLNAGDNSILLGGNIATGLEGVTEAWTSKSIALPAVANGLSVKIEFRFESDADTEAYAGFYIDGVEVIAQ